MTRSDTGPFAIVPRWLLHMEDIRGGDIYVYALLAEHADKAGASHYAHKTMAQEIGCSVDTIKRHLKALVEHEAISIKHRKTQLGSPTTNEYTVYRMPPKKARRGPRKNAPSTPHQSSTDPDSMNETLRGEDDTPSARNLNSSGEKMEAWEDFLARLSSRRSEGIQSPIFNPSSYARRCAQNGGWPPDVDLDILFDVARAVKFGLGRKVVILPALEAIQDTATYFQKCRQVAGEDFVAWLTDTVSMVGTPLGRGSLAADKLLLHALTQSGTLRPFSEWEAEQAVRA